MIPGKEKRPVFFARGRDGGDGYTNVNAGNCCAMKGSV